MSSPKVLTFYKSNMPVEIVTAQKAVFDHFGIEVEQCLDDSLSHAAWMDRQLAAGGDDVTVIADIDAFPLRPDGIEAMVAKARGGQLCGLAQTANHKDPDRVYAGPMFMAVPAGLYEALGQPSMARTDRADVAQTLTDRVEDQGGAVSLIYPRFAIQPKWPLSDRGVFGIGTFYGEMDFFHLFESRKKRSVELLCCVAEDTISGRFDFARYLEIVRDRRFKFF